MRSIVRVLAILAVVGAGMTAAVSGVLAFEARVINVNAKVGNAIAIDKTFDWDPADGRVYPEEFLKADLTVKLSGDFLSDPTGRVDTVTVDVILQCPKTGVFWAGDFAYMAPSDPGLILPGGGTGNFYPASYDSSGELPLGLPASFPAFPTVPPPPTTPNSPWIYVGGDASLCPGTQTRTVFSEATLDPVVLVKGGQETQTITLGYDIPVCDYQYNASTDVLDKPSGYGIPSVVLDSADPRYPVITPGPCQYTAGVQAVFQVRGITAAVVNTAPVVNITSPVAPGDSSGIYTLSATVTDDFDSSATLEGALVWTHSTQGSLGVGNNIPLVPISVPGTITATVTDSGSLVGFDDVVLTTP